MTHVFDRILSSEGLQMKSTKSSDITMSKSDVEQMVKNRNYGDPVPVAAWGKDHWSMFGYLETRTVDFKGIPDVRHMRGRRGVLSKYPTRLAHGVVLEHHSDWDCLDDLEEAGLIENIGTGINPLIRMTERGRVAASALRDHKANGGMFGNFKVQV